jgi:hypothetical protein
MGVDVHHSMHSLQERGRRSPLSQIDHGDTALLRAHLARCARSVDLSTVVGDLLNHFI